MKTMSQIIQEGRKLSEQNPKREDKKLVKYNIALEILTEFKELRSDPEIVKCIEINKE